MKTSDFDYELPDELIAKYPLKNRDDSRLLTFIDQKIQHRTIKELLSNISSKDLLVFNRSSVIPARLFGNKETGGKVEVFLERLLGENKAMVQLKSSTKILPNQLISFTYPTKTFKTEVISKQDDFYETRWEESPAELFINYGVTPLPPYLNREAECSDVERYQNLYADPAKKLSVAAPTAGLHFSEMLLHAIKEAGVVSDYIYLHVGSGTFKPVKVENIADHKMHSEYIEVTEATVQKIKTVKKSGGKIVAVGTTTLRALETAFQADLDCFQGDTNIFIHPGFKFKAVDMLLTNFHQPKSSLLMLVSAFVGYDAMKTIYAEALEKRYRFLSYGDAMLLEKA
ncbi:MAG: tRNA preQ1(34) S-adenosylmethionine ribosyltransferase-isomerase QueA [Gammaproteobacteria bacterium]